MELINIYKKKVLKLFTDQLIGRTLLQHFTDFANDNQLAHLIEKCTDYCLKRELTPNEKFGIAMIIRYATEISENNGK